MTYDEANDKMRAAYAVYVPIRDAYHAGVIDDETFLVARKAYKQAEAEYDIAYQAAVDDTE